LVVVMRTAEHHRPHDDRVTVAHEADYRQPTARTHAHISTKRESVRRPERRRHTYGWAGYVRSHLRCCHELYRCKE
jgi:hypothetical protein